MEGLSRTEVSRTLEACGGWKGANGSGPRWVGEITYCTLQKGRIIMVGRQLRYISKELGESLNASNTKK